MYTTPTTSGQEGPTEDSLAIKEICGDVIGEQMHLVARVYAGVAPEPIGSTWDAAKGPSAIKKDDLTDEETAYVLVAPSDAPLPPSGQYDSCEFTAAFVSTKGHSAVWDGVSVDPCVQMVSGAIAFGVDATRVAHLGRIFGLVTGELMWTQECTLDGEDEVNIEISGRLMRITQASAESDRAIEGINDIQDGLLV